MAELSKTGRSYIAKELYNTRAELYVSMNSRILRDAREKFDS